MKRQTIYCSACDRQVTVELADDNATSLEGAVCFDIGAACTGTLCPICAVAPAQLRDRLKKQERPQNT